MKAREVEAILEAAKNRLNAAEDEFYDEGKGSYSLLKDYEMLIKHLERALDILPGLEIEGLI